MTLWLLRRQLRSLLARRAAPAAPADLGAHPVAANDSKQDLAA